MNYEFLPEARDEFWEAALYYETEVTGLGVRFREEVERVINHIVSDPLLWRERSGGYRRGCPRAQAARLLEGQGEECLTP